MRVQLILLLALLVSCGKDVKFTNQLESNSLVTQAEPIAVTQSAVITRSSANPPGTVSMNGKTYRISPFSSYVALNFVNQQVDGVGVSVKIRGEVQGSEIYLKVIE